VTKKTLSELDLPCIMSNITLRMDANFDRDLHFKPDLDGEKGKRKRKEAADYWDAMAAEIAIYSFCAANTDAVPEERTDGTRKTFEPRLPAMFETLQDVIKTLVPTDDHASVTQNLEVSLLMQQIRKGVLDMVSLATWLAALFKTHCAPMRDEWADRMVEQITEGSQSQDPQKIVNGLQTLFAILEAMKLVSFFPSTQRRNSIDPFHRTWPTTRSAHFGSFSSRTRCPFCKSISKPKSATAHSRSNPHGSGTSQHGRQPGVKTNKRVDPSPKQAGKTSNHWKRSSAGSAGISFNLTRQKTSLRHFSSTLTGCGSCGRRCRT
jgi:hypothetical protein